MRGMRAIVVVGLCASIAHADDAPTFGGVPMPPPSGPIASSETLVPDPPRSSLVLAPRFDPYCKTAGRSSAQSFGLGVHYLVDFPPRYPVWYGGGIDARVLTSGWNDIGAFAIGGVAKVTGGHAPPITLELDGGAIIADGNSGGYAGGAVLLSMFYLELGYAYQRTIGVDDPAWFGRHQFVIRGIIPVLTR